MQNDTIYVALDDSKRKLVIAMLRSGATEPEEREMPKDPSHIVMAYLGLVPSEYSSGETQRRGGLTKTGNTHARRVLIEAAWHYRHRPTVGRAPASRSQAQPEEVVGQAWRAQQRLHRRYRHLIGHGKRPLVAVAAIARELVGFLWAAMTRREMRPHVA